MHDFYAQNVYICSEYRYCNIKKKVLPQVTCMAQKCLTSKIK